VNFRDSSLRNFPSGEGCPSGGVCRHRHAQRGSLILLVMCLLAVLGIALASYLAVSNQAMKLSNRSYAKDVSKNLAEMGLEQALQAFDSNDWSSWTNVSGSSLTSTDTAAYRTITFSQASAKFGTSGIAGKIKLRVDNYNAFNKTSTWAASTNYSLGDRVGNNGIWYRCLQSHTSSAANGPPNLAYWAQDPIPWMWSSYKAYVLYDVVNYNGTWYRCILAHTNHAPPNATYWLPIPSISLSWSSTTTYTYGAMVFDNGAWYYNVNSANTNHATSDTNRWVQVLSASGTAGSYTNPTSNTYATGDAFATGDFIYRSGSSAWFRCIAPQPYNYGSGDYSNTSLWVNVGGSPSFSSFDISWAWRSSATYAYNDLVYYSASGSGSWYRCKVASSSHASWTAADWEDALTGPMWAWNSGSINYNLGHTVYYSATNKWYRCVFAHQSTTSTTPDSTTYPYWSTDPLQSNAWDPGRQYAANDTVSYNGIWYLCHAANSGTPPPTDTTKWYSTANSSYYWNPATAYSASTSFVSYGGVWYQCLAGNTAVTPNNLTDWKSLGAPVIYAEGTATLPDRSPAIKTQLRATVDIAPLFPNAAGSATTLKAASSSTAGIVDSYDGSVSGLSANGSTTTNAYSANVGYSAVLAAANCTLSTDCNINNTTVHGYVAAPPATSTPYAPLWTRGGSATLIGNSLQSGVQLTQVSRSPYVPQFSTQPAGGLNTNWASVAIGTALNVSTAIVNIGIPGATMPSCYFYNGTLNIGGIAGSISTLNIIGPVILYVNSDLNVAGSLVGHGVIKIFDSGSAEIHVGRSLMVDSNSFGIINYTLDPKRLVLICDTSANSLQYYNYTGLNYLYGVIYAPNTTDTTGFNFGNSPTTTMYGAVSANKINYAGNVTLHYDTSLRYAAIPGVDQPYTISEWRELTDQSEQVTLP